MSLAQGLPWQWKQLSFNGYSIAGQTTSLFFNNAKICFDIGQGLPFNINAKLYCLTHLHADHGAGINYLLSQRSLFGFPTAPILLPQSAVDPIFKILKQWEKIEGFKFDFELIPMKAGTRFAFSKQYLIEAFPTNHRVESFGYLVYVKKKKLKKEFLGLERQELLDLKSRGQLLEEDVLEPKMAFTGDTKIEFLQNHKDLSRVELLFMECTNLDEKKSIEDTRKWGHTHLDEIIEKASFFENEKISLIHLSARYSSKEAEKILTEKLPESLREKVSLFPRPF